MATKRRFHVVGPHAVDGVAPGRTVTLDPEQVNIEALIEAGHIAVKAPPTSQPAADGEAGE